MRLENVDDLKALFHEMAGEFVASEKAPPEKQNITRDLECADPSARGAVSFQTISAEALGNIIGAAIMTDAVIQQGIAPCDICCIELRMHYVEALLDEETGEVIDEEWNEPHWTPIFRVAFKPTNGWKPEGEK